MSVHKSDARARQRPTCGNYRGLNRLQAPSICQTSKGGEILISSLEHTSPAGPTEDHIKTLSKHSPHSIIHHKLCLYENTNQRWSGCMSNLWFSLWMEGGYFSSCFLITDESVWTFFYGPVNRLTETSLKSNCRRNIKISSLFWQFQSELSSTGGPQLHVSRK